MIKWVYSYDGYKRLASEPPVLHDVLQPLWNAISESGEIPAWAGVDLLKGLAFTMMRDDHWDKDVEYTLARPEFMAIVDAIQRHPPTRSKDWPPLLGD